MTTVNCHPYDETVDESQQRSLAKALVIFEKQEEERKREISAKIKRPNVSVYKGLFVFVGALVLLLSSVWFLGILGVSLSLRILVALIAGFITLIAFARKTITWLILVYQKVAPDALRLACVFEPSCSEYMLIAIEKYGVFRGVGKGINRLCRCRYPNGDIDYP